MNKALKNTLNLFNLEEIDTNLFVWDGISTGYGSNEVKQTATKTPIVGLKPPQRIIINDPSQDEFSFMKGPKSAKRSNLDDGLNIEDYQRKRYRNIN